MRSSWLHLFLSWCFSRFSFYFFFVFRFSWQKSFYRLHKAEKTKKKWCGFHFLFSSSFAFAYLTQSAFVVVVVVVVLSFFFLFTSHFWNANILFICNLKFCIAFCSGFSSSFCWVLVSSLELRRCDAYFTSKIEKKKNRKNKT